VGVTDICEEIKDQRKKGVLRTSVAVFLEGEYIDDSRVSCMPMREKGMRRVL
jgi:hypothetical protein